MIAPFNATNQNQNTDLSDNNDCPICLISIDDGFTTICNHTFCKQCLVEALTRNPSCPICRQCNIHNCTTPDNECILCMAGHNPAIVTPNVFLNDVNMSYSPFAYMSSYEFKVVSAKLSLIFSIQLYAAYQCLIRTIPLWSFCIICLISTITSMLIVSKWSPRYILFVLNHFINRCFRHLPPPVNHPPPHLEV